MSECRVVRVGSEQYPEQAYRGHFGESKWRLLGRDIPSQNDLIELDNGDLARLKVVVYRIKSDAPGGWIVQED